MTVFDQIFCHETSNISNFDSHWLDLWPGQREQKVVPRVGSPNSKRHSPGAATSGLPASRC